MAVAADASDEYVEDRDTLALIVVASVRLFTSDADGVISAWVEVTAPAAAAAAVPPVVDIELDDCEDEFRR